MRFWFTPSTEVPLREQIVQQIRLGILDGQMQAGARLPSTRHFARRYGMHANTVSAAFQQLQQEGWVTSRHGSGTFVSPVTRDGAGQSTQASPPETRLASLLLQAAQVAHSIQVPGEQLHRMLEEMMHRTRMPVRQVLVEPDAALARIVQHEIASDSGMHLPHLRMHPSEFAMRLPRALRGATAVVLPSKAAAACAALSADQVVTLPIETVSAALASRLPLERGYLVAVVSCWQPFLHIARTMLVSAGFAAESILLRDTAQPRWHNGLELVEAVVCDSLTAEQLATQRNVFPFRILTASALARLQEREPV